MAVRFTYGESVYLSAVARALRACHYSIKQYKPCGIVCPKREVRERMAPRAVVIKAGKL